jgi:ABC-2 type transport system ATP-binding protein
MIIRTESLSKHYGPNKALNNCNLEVAEGTSFGLLGPNGSGKTTLIRLLMGYLRPSDGAAWIGGRDCYSQSLDVHRRVAYLPAEPRLFPEMRCGDVLRFFGEIRKGSCYPRSVRVAERLKLDLSLRVSQLSTGMKRKLALAITFAADTPILILDEPTSNLDPTVRREVLTLSREAREDRRTVIISSNVLADVEQLCDRVALIRGGELVHEQSMAELQQKHRIRAVLRGEWADPPAHLADRLTISHGADNQVTIVASEEISPLLGWLATLPMTEVRIEPVGLQDIYDRFYPASAA